MSKLADEILDNVDIVDIIGDYLNLKKIGKNYVALCPFHKEKTPSFTVSPSKQIFKCFGCGKGGNAISFIMEIERLDFLEGVDLLADKAGVDLDDFKFDSEKYKKFSENKKAYKTINQYTLNFFKDKLQDSKKALKYLHENRQLSDDIIDRFDIGYAPDSYYEFVNYLNQKSIDYEDASKLGLIRSRQSSDRYAFFKDRIMFPIYDHMDNVVGFAGRALDGDNTPKYLNVPETPLYDKSKVLYGLNLVKEHMRDYDYVIMTEGYMDVIALHRAGLPVGVASCGTSLTNKHIKLLQRYTDNLVLSFDNDDAGFDATKRSLKLAYELNIFPKVLRITTDHKDIDELVDDKDISNLDIYESEYFSIVDGFEYILDQLIDRIGLESPNARQDIISQGFGIISSIKQNTEAIYYLEGMADSIGINYDVLFSQFKSYLKNKSKFNKTSSGGKDTQNSSRIDSKYMLAGLIYNDFLEENELDTDGIYGFLEFLMMLSEYFPNSLLYNVVNETLSSEQKDKLLEAQLWWEKHFETAKYDKQKEQVKSFLQRQIHRLTRVVIKSKKLGDEEKDQLLKTMRKLG